VAREIQHLVGDKKVSTEVMSKAERAYISIKDSINDGTFGPGYRLVLGPIARDLEISVVPVREAIRRLEAERLVTFTPNVGAQVATTNSREYRHTMETLSLVEGWATAAAAPNISSEEIALARKINRELRDCLEAFDPARFTQLNHEFHAVLFEPCTNPHVLDLVHRGWNRLAVIRESTFSLVPGRALKSVEEHDALVDLIEAKGSFSDIELAARNHRLTTLNEYLATQSAIDSKKN
jgi:DNA-binding GntR family transcriptional regulator